MNLSRISFFILSSILMFTCTTEPTPIKKAKPKTQKPQPLNQLTPQEITAGWELLFNGKTTNAWQAYATDTFPHRTWQADPQGNLVATKNAPHLITKRKFENFDLKIEYQTHPQLNSGIFYRVVSSADQAIWKQALEYQITNDTSLRRGGGLETEKHRTGAVYDLFASDKISSPNQKEWKRARIVILNDHVEHWMDDELILQFKIGDEEWNTNLAQSKLGQIKGFGKTSYGHIGLQGKGSAMKFRNIKIKEL